ncbi:MAG TPA: glycosyltransferase [Thermomicrobiales bacterium]|jgi:glycosyltransferase involved in cell wall biosynthesis
MKIVLLIRSLTFGGAERQLIALAKGLHARGHDVHVGVFYAGGPLEEDLHAAGVPVTALDKGGRWDMARFLFRLARFLRRERPHVVHGYLGGSNSLAVLMRPLHGARVVWGIRASDLDGDRYDWFYRLDGFVERWLARFPDLIITNSHAGRDHVVHRGFPKDRTIVIPNGIDAERFRPDAPLRAAARARLGVEDDDLLVGRVGRLDHQKDYPTFLRAAAEVARQRPATCFLCVGTGPADLERQLRELGEDLGLGDRLIWAGPRDDMPAIYNALDVMVSSSAYGEGLPNVVAEAMACGVPCAVTDSGDSAWVVGDLGRVVPASNVAALATGTIELLDAVANRAVDHAAIRRRIVRELSLERLVDQTEQALRPLVREWSAT